MQELVLFVGFPCLGKTTSFGQHFEPAGCLYINQDTLKTRINCLEAVQEALTAGAQNAYSFLPLRIPLELGCSENTSTRRYYIDVAMKLKVPVRFVVRSHIVRVSALLEHSCMLFTDSRWPFHNNLYRAYCQDRRARNGGGTCADQEG